MKFRNERETFLKLKSSIGIVRRIYNEIVLRLSSPIAFPSLVNLFFPRMDQTSIVFASGSFSQALIKRRENTKRGCIEKRRN